MTLLSDDSPGLFYGWKVVAALFVMLTFSSGLGFYNHSIILQALSRESGFPIELASTAVSVFFLVSGISGLYIARLIEKYDIRLVIGAGTLLASLSIYLVGKVSTIAELLIVYSLFGIGFTGSGLLPATTLIARWFEANRAKALSIASTGLSVGGILLTPLSASLVENYSLYVASDYISLLYLVGILPISWLILRSFPVDMDLTPDGRGTKASTVIDGIPFRQAIRHPFFWTLSISYVLVMSGQVGGIAHQYGVLTERLSTAQVYIGMATLPAFSVVGRLIGGVMLDQVDTLKFTLVMMVLQGMALGILGCATSVYLFFFGIALFGSCMGNLLMLQPLIVAEIYGLVNYSQIFSWSNMITVAGVAGGPVLMGVLFGYSGSYLLPYLIAGGLCLMAAVVFVAARPPVTAE